LLYGTHLVPVGEDQKQHVELTRDLAIRLRNLYGEDLFPIPEPWIPKVGARIMSLQNPLQKKKSDADPHATVFMDDEEAVILKKVKRAVTDSGSEITWDESKPGVKNLLTIQSAITGKTPDELVTSYQGKMYGHLKVETAQILADALKPIRGEAKRLLIEKTELEKILASGAERARSRAQPRLNLLKERLGMILPHQK
jgi:tryptophanyl-tRNA synthetase